MDHNLHWKVRSIMVQGDIVGTPEPSWQLYSAILGPVYLSWRKSSPCRNGFAGPKTTENGCHNGSAIVTKYLLSPDIRCCGAWVCSKDMSAVIVYSLNKTVHSSNKITYKSNQSAHPRNEIAFSSNETCYPGLRMHPNLGKTSGYKYKTNLTVNLRWRWWFSRRGTISVAGSVSRGA